MHLSCRLKVASPFYQEFKDDAAPALEAGAQSAPTSTALASKLHAAAPTSKDLEAQIAKAVVSVIGASVDRDQPLVAAGLDSLGEAPYGHFHRDQFNSCCEGLLGHCWMRCNMLAWLLTRPANLLAYLDMAECPTFLLGLSAK